MKAAIHQPAYLPYPGYFQKMAMADVFVVMDDVQYDKRYTNRNQILVPQGPIWLSVPIEKDDKFLENRQVRINNSLDWRTEHLKKIQKSYAKSPFYGEYQGELERVISKEWKFLMDLDLALVELIAGWLGIRVKTVKESELNSTGASTERLVNTCKAVGADCYVSGAGGKNYMEESMFSNNGLSVVYQQYEPLPYKQRFMEEFVPNLSIIDMLFNVGPDSAELIKPKQEPRLAQRILS